MDKMDDIETALPIGRVIGTERKPNTAYTFNFWTALDADLGIGSVVRVVAGSATVYGTVVEVLGFNDLESPLHEFLSVGGKADTECPTERPEMRVFQAAVLRRVPDEPISAVPIGLVYRADEDDLQRALRTDSYASTFGIPAGCYGSLDNPMAVHLHSSFLLGPEAGHMNMTGTSGLAAKTSFILFLLKSIFTHYRDEPNTHGDQGVAALLFNTKGGDLLYLDVPATNDEFDDKDRRIYEACQVDAGPFEHVKYFAPYARDGVNLNTLRRNSELESTGEPTQPFTFGLREAIKHAEVLLNRDDLDAKADAYLQYLNDRFVEGNGHMVGSEKMKADTLDDLVRIVKRQIDVAESQGMSQMESHSVFTIRKMYNRILNLGKRFSGLIAEGKQPEGPLTTAAKFEPNTVYVIDVAQLASDEQDLVFAGVITKLRERMEEGTLGVGRLVVVVDELNKYAPSSGHETYVLKSLKEIAARGRYLGLTLFGAQQFRSRVDKEVVGNAATHAFGHIEAEEMAQPGYSYFSPAVKEKLGALSPGEILIKHPHFAQPIFIRFPRPASMKGSEGMKRYRPGGETSPTDLILQQVTRLRGSSNAALDALSGVSQEKEALIEIFQDLRAMPLGADPIARIKRGKRSASVFQAPEAKATLDDEFDPFA
jgi:DNA helicase HerA-like ATPase